MRQLTPEQMVRALNMLGSDAEWRKELRKTYRQVGKVGADLSRSRMRASGDRQLAAAAKGIRGTSNPTQARVAASRGRTAAATWGTKKRTGWFGNPKYQGSRSRNNPTWVGASWRAAVKGEGPRGINDALADGIPQINAKFAEAADDLIKRAF